MGPLITLLMPLTSFKATFKLYDTTCSLDMEILFITLWTNLSMCSVCSVWEYVHVHVRVHVYIHFGFVLEFEFHQNCSRRFLEMNWSKQQQNCSATTQPEHWKQIPMLNIMHHNDILQQGDKVNYHRLECFHMVYAPLSFLLVFCWFSAGDSAWNMYSLDYHVDGPISSVLHQI